MNSESFVFSSILIDNSLNVTYIYSHFTVEIPQGRVRNCEIRSIHASAALLLAGTRLTGQTCKQCAPWKTLLHWKSTHVCNVMCCRVRYGAWS